MDGTIRAANNSAMKKPLRDGAPSRRPLLRATRGRPRVSTKIHAGEVVIEYDVLVELVHAGWRRLTFGITTRSPRNSHPAPRIRYSATAARRTRQKKP